MENKKKREILLAVAAVFISLFLYRFFGRMVKGLVEDEFLGNMLAQAVFALLVLAAVLLLKKTEIFRSDLNALINGWFSAGFLLFLILFLFCVGTLPSANMTVTTVQILYFAVQILLIGFCEETLFRGLVQNSLHAYFGEDSRKHILLAVFISGAVFGLTHLTNGLQPGVDLFAAGCQAVVTAFMGAYLGAVYCRTGKNLWYLMLLHGLYDGGALIVSGALSGNNMVSIIGATGSAGVQGILIWVGVYLVLTLFLLRKEKIAPFLKEPEFRRTGPEI